MIVVNLRRVYAIDEIKVMKWLKKGANLHLYHIANLIDYFYFKVIQT